MGRPSKYEDTHPERVRRLCMLGLTNDELAVAFGVAVSTINKWASEHPEFSDAQRAGRQDADSYVAESLYRQALDGNVTAQIFWLKNRRRESWRDKQDHEVTGKDGGAIILWGKKPA